MRKIILLAAAALGLTACGLYGRYERPDLDAEYVETATVLPWRSLYTDPCLQALVDTALLHATSLQVALQQVEEARAGLEKTRLAYLPAVVADGDADLRSGDITLGGNASWQIDLFGRLRNARMSASSSLESKEAYAQAVRSALVAGVASAYYNLLALDRQREISVRTLENWDKTISTLESLKAAGKTNDIAVLQAKAKKIKLESAARELLGSIEMAQNNLCALIGTVPAPILRGRLDDISFPEEAFENVPLSATASRPDVRQAEAALAAAFYTTAGARSAFYPDLTLNGSAAWLTTGGNAVWSALAALAAPVLSRGANRAALKTAAAREEEARLQFRQSLLDAGTEVNNALAAYRSAADRIEIDTRQRDALAQAVEKIELMMRYSTTNYLEVLTAEQSLLDAELGLVSDRLALVRATTDLYQALGGGSEP